MPSHCARVFAMAVVLVVEPLALVLGARFPSVNAVAVGLADVPLADVRFSVEASPDAVPLLNPVPPLAIVDLPIFPSVNALSTRLAQIEATIVAVSVCVAFEAFAMPFVLVPASLVLSTV